MDTSKLYEDDFPTLHKVQDTDVVTLYHEERFDELDAVIICKNRDGIITATFGENVWNCLPFSRRKQKNNLSFEEFNSTPKLQREMKLLCFGWLFNKDPKKRSALAFTSIETKLVSIKIAYRFLVKNNHCSLADLSNLDVWTKFEKYLIASTYKQKTLEKNVFCTQCCNRVYNMA